MKTIAERDLIPGRYYLGSGRFLGNIAFWGGAVFHGWAFECGSYVPAESIYGESGFSPRQIVNIPGV